MKRLIPPALLLLILMGWYSLGRLPPTSGDLSGRSFDPERMATLEVDMWKAYYNKQEVALFGHLVSSLREQWGLGWTDSVKVAYLFARAASEFSSKSPDQGRVLTKLEKGYISLQAVTQQPFDARHVARLELDWWLARRDPDLDDPREVAKIMAAEYSELFQVPEFRVYEAAALRATAAKTRDGGGENPDWGTIADYLRGSYRSLSLGLNDTSPPPSKPTPEPTPQSEYPP